MWLSLVTALISLAGSIARFMADRESRRAGSTAKELEHLQKVQRNVRKATLALDVLDDNIKLRLQERYRK